MSALAYQNTYQQRHVGFPPLAATKRDPGPKEEDKGGIKQEIQLPEGLRRESMPQHVTVIMDGNSRWARQRGWLTPSGHEAGFKSLIEFMKLCLQWDIKVLTVFAFSIDNWNRPKAEVGIIMSLIEKLLKSEIDDFMMGGTRVSVIGDTSRLPKSLQRTIRDTEEMTRGNSRLHFIMAVSYSGTYDVAQACKRITDKVKDGAFQVEDINVSLVAQELETKCCEFPCPDLLIRTSGELRISNFLLWQSVYSELFFAKQPWPDFGKDEFVEALISYQQRQSQAQSLRLCRASKGLYHSNLKLGKPREDPLLVYLIGGPGCSTLTGFFFQAGPLIFNTTDYLGGLPELLYNPYSWTKTASIIFVDYPVGTGYSYATTSEAYHLTDTTSAKQVHQFLRKWLIDHPEFTEVPFFLASDSYAGNEAGLQSHINLKGFASGSPHTDRVLERNSRVTLAYRLALISRSLYESAENSCKGNYVDVDPCNAACLEDLEKIEPNSEYVLVDKWANDKRVQDALHVRRGTVRTWYRCNLFLQDVLYTYNILSAVDYYQNLTRTGLKILIYSGDHDMAVPYISTERWINSLNITVDSDWRPWFVDGQVAGYTVNYADYGFRLTFATLKGAGHSPTQYATGWSNLKLFLYYYLLKMKKIQESLRSLSVKLGLKKMKKEAGYEKLVANPRRHFLVYVSDEEPDGKLKRYDVPIACTSSIIFQALLRQFEDILMVDKVPITLSCSKQMFKSALKLSVDGLWISEVRDS
ncbi:unnamed protein product [Dovyalis caffra]|uniref:Alkyl transferase n=1 Tax=Dovyalis caffra TaxID=77055 RepID=A0AAV1R3I6_9ROSI|nr:unnamed protein product [Dovyalis caffra]